MRLLHISDLHFGPFFIPEIGEALLASAAGLAPDLIVASGDFTQRAKRTEFAAARSFLEKLPAVPRIVVPGNHDVPLYRVFERLFEPYRNYRETISDRLDCVIEGDGYRVVALNTTSPLRAITNGRVHRSQLGFCAEAFSRCPPGTLKVVVAHHHFAPAPDFRGSEVMPRAAEILELLTELRVNLILGGHLHRAYIGTSLDVQAGPNRDHGIIIVQCGTSTSRRGRGREREKNSFNLIEINEQTIEVKHFLYFSSEGGFRVQSRHLFPRESYLSVS